jgi:hypothetical protein
MADKKWYDDLPVPIDWPPAVLFEVALNNFAQALLDAGKDITDQALLAMANRAVAGWISTQERRTN